MKQLPENILSRMTYSRVRAHRTIVLAHINQTEFDYNYKHDVLHRIGAVVDYPGKDELYAYRDLVNKYFDRLKNAPKCT